MLETVEVADVVIIKGRNTSNINYNRVINNIQHNAEDALQDVGEYYHEYNQDKDDDYYIQENEEEEAAVDPPSSSIWLCRESNNVDEDGIYCVYNVYNSLGEEDEQDNNLILIGNKKINMIN